MTGYLLVATLYRMIPPPALAPPVPVPVPPVLPVLPVFLVRPVPIIAPVLPAPIPPMFLAVPAPIPPAPPAPPILLAPPVPLVPLVSISPVPMWVVKSSGSCLAPSFTPTRHSAFPSPSAQFKGFVAQVIYSTRLTSGAVIISLKYVQRYARSSWTVDFGEYGPEYKLFTVAVMLAHKWSEDHTFKNKTWSEVTSIPLAELNRLEMALLEGLDYNVSVNATEYSYWYACLQEFTKIQGQPRLTLTDTSTDGFPSTASSSRYGIAQPPSSPDRKNRSYTTNAEPSTMALRHIINPVDKSPISYFDDPVKGRTSSPVSFLRNAECSEGGANASSTYVRQEYSYPSNFQNQSSSVRYLLTPEQCQSTPLLVHDLGNGEVKNFDNLNRVNSNPPTPVNLNPFNPVIQQSSSFRPMIRQNTSFKSAVGTSHNSNSYSFKNDHYGSVQAQQGMNFADNIGELLSRFFNYVGKAQPVQPRFNPTIAPPPGFGYENLPMYQQAYGDGATNDNNARDGNSNDGNNGYCLNSGSYGMFDGLDMDLDWQ
ncbi:hypothetical protein Glove_26g129 [Diversispora epigaea]|uniref:Cyclin N-terminal domain-containing protein n=1 Tax=Diversispora epigaea TaxID=1348612 RepID=A0A397JTD3_9GLOM|nr:hypothetical protein Glove_26g129 [Diversispora epigaea]